MQEKKSVLKDTNIFIDNNLTARELKLKSKLVSLAKDFKKDRANKVVIRQNGLIVNDVFMKWDEASNTLKESPAPLRSLPVAHADNNDHSTINFHSKND